MKENKKIEWSEFVKGCKSTIKPPCGEFSYLLPGMKAEVGEILGVFAKCVRGDFDEDEFVKRMMSESGDVMWFLGVISTLIDLDEVECIYDGPVIRQTVVMEEVEVVLDNLFSACSIIDIKTGIRPFLILLNKLGIAVGFSLYECMNGVLEKLAKRKDKGTIQGDGETNGERVANKK
jgi:hypothetical protein